MPMSAQQRKKVKSLSAKNEPWIGAKKFQDKLDNEDDYKAQGKQNIESKRAANVANRRGL